MATSNGKAERILSTLSNCSKFPKCPLSEIIPPSEKEIFGFFFFFCPMIVFSKGAFLWGEGLKGHGRGSSNVHSSIFIPFCMSNVGGVVLHVYIFNMICELFRGINGVFLPNNCISKGDFMSLGLLLSFAILVLLKPIPLLLFTRLVRLGRIMFLLVRILRRLMSRIEILLFQWSLMRVVLVPLLIVSRRTVSDNIGPICRSWRFFKFDIGNSRG